MIKLKLKYYNGSTLEEIITPTVFPDGTTQVYKIESLTKEYKNVVETQIVWMFENESELMHIAQLSDLLSSYTGVPQPSKTLYMPFLPYGRQDKYISNQTTFAQHSLANLINAMKFDKVISFDVHGISSIKDLHRISANELIKKLFEEKQYELYCYPDGGACERYLHEPSFNGIKEREQGTGKIVDYYLNDEYKNAKGEWITVDIENKKVLVVDDLCDQGGTFLKLIEMIKERKPAEVNLYVSHMIGGPEVIQKLKDAGYTNIYYTNSILKNIDGINVL